MGTNKNSCKTAAVMNLLSRRPEAARPARDGVSDSDTTAREQIEYIDIDHIDGDPRNFYELSGLDELAASIELLGLQQPIRVRPGEEPGRYVIVSGHRRRAAAARLVEGGRDDLRALPCIVERQEESSAFQELRLIFANSATRRMSPAETGRQAERVEALLYQLKEEGYEFPGRMRDYVAEACRVSKSKLARLKVIQGNLDQCWRPGYDKGTLAESAAYALAQMPQARQQVMFEGLKNKGQYPASARENTIQSYGASLAQVEKIQCATYGSGPCVNREAMQRKVMSENAWSYNRCTQCCETCAELAKCKYACPMLAEQVKELKAELKTKKQQEKQAQEERTRPAAEQIKALWKRFGEARAASGRSPEECYRAGGMYYGDGSKDVYGQLERQEAKINENTKLPYGYSCYLSNVLAYVKLADLLGVSLDYLLCRTDDPAGFARGEAEAGGACGAEGQLAICGWMPGGTQPFQPCDVVADFDLAGTGRISRMACRFDRGCFRYEKSGDAIRSEAVRWMALPPVVSESDTEEGGKG